MQCIKCGSLMRETDRCCMSCGALNMNNQENNYMQPLVTKVEKKMKDKPVVEKDYNYYKNKLIKEKQNEKTATLIIWIVIGIITFLEVLGLIFFGTILANLLSSFGLPEGIVIFSNVILIFIVILSNFQFACKQMIIKKAKMNWWGMYIPLYKDYLMYEVSLDKGWYFLLPTACFYLINYSSNYTYLISQTGVICLAALGAITISVLEIYKNINLAKRFEVNPILTVLFPYIMYPIIALNPNVRDTYQ